MHGRVSGKHSDGVTSPGHANRRVRPRRPRPGQQLRAPRESCPRPSPRMVGANRRLSQSTGLTRHWAGVLGDSAVIHQSGNHDGQPDVNFEMKSKVQQLPRERRPGFSPTIADAVAVVAGGRGATVGGQGLRRPRVAGRSGGPDGSGSSSAGGGRRRALRATWPAR